MARSALCVSTRAPFAVYAASETGRFLGSLDLPMPERLLLHLPLALAVADGCLALGFSVNRVGDRSRTRGVRLREVAPVVVSVELTAQLGVWHLIGWGLT